MKVLPYLLEDIYSLIWLIIFVIFLLYGLAMIVTLIAMAGHTVFKFIKRKPKRL